MPHATDTVDVHGRPLVLPRIHLGGSPASRLVELHSDVLVMLRQARSAMEDAEPNGRDYVGLPNAEARLAAEQHQLRLERLDQLIVEHEALQAHAADARDARGS